MPVRPSADIQPKLSPKRVQVVILALVVMSALLILGQRVRDRGPSGMRTAGELLAVHQRMAQAGISGFLPGDHANLGEGLRRKRFTSVTVLPDMVSGTHSVSVLGMRFGTSLVLFKESGTNVWTAWRDVHFGSRYWKTELGTLTAP